MNERTKQIIGAMVVLFIAGSLYLAYEMNKPIEVNPEKQEVVLEGFSGSNAVVETRNEFTGGQNAVLVNPNPQEVVKEGVRQEVPSTKHDMTIDEIIEALNGLKDEHK